MDVRERIAMRDIASFPFWWERTRQLDIPQPKTEYVPYDTRSLINVMDGDPLDVEPLLKAAENVGGYPVFVRTDQMSGKHSWKDTCYVESADVMLRHACSLIDENLGHDLYGEALPSGFAVREFLDLDWDFTAFWGELPVAVEVRTFVRDGAVECVHQYWPEEAIGRWAEPPQAKWDHTKGAGMPKRDVPDDWRDRLAAHGVKIDRDAKTIRRQAKKVAKVMDGWWSCDMALGRDGIWYLIDLAPGAASYHLPSCGHAQAE